MPYIQYEIYYGYNGDNSAHYSLQGFNDFKEVLKRIDNILKDSSYEYCYVIRVVKERIFYKDLRKEKVL